jgi:hypothetical protein
MSQIYFSISLQLNQDPGQIRLRNILYRSLTMVLTLLTLLLTLFLGMRVVKLIRDLRDMRQEV